MIENLMENARFGRQWGVIRFTEAERAARYRIRNPERGVWAAMIDRCHNPRNATYHAYPVDTQRVDGARTMCSTPSRQPPSND